MESATIFLAHADPTTLESLSSDIATLGHRIIGSATTRADLLAECVAHPPDLIVSGTDFPDGDGIEALIEISAVEPCPAILIAPDDRLSKVEEAMADHVMAYLVAPVTAEDLKPAILVVLRRFAQFEDLRKENENLREALATRKVLERAKGLLMAEEGITEEEAYLRIRDLATGGRIKLKDAAALVVGRHVGDPA